MKDTGIPASRNISGMLKCISLHPDTDTRTETNHEIGNLVSRIFQLYVLGQIRMLQGTLNDYTFFIGFI